MVEPASKKPRKDVEEPEQPVAGPSRAASSRIFAPFRALGYVCNHVPFAMFVHTPKGALATPTVNVVVSVGSNWMMWDAGRMTLVFVGTDAGSPITSLEVTGTEVFVAAGTKVIRYIRGKEAGKFLSPDHQSIGKIMIFGEQLLGLREDGTGLYIWNLASRKLENQLTFHSSFIATTMLHPATYLNKVIIGSQSGGIQLWNIRTCTMIHSFPTPTDSPITALAQSPALDVIGIGHTDGTIRLHDTRLDESIMQLNQTDGAVTSLSFRMDGPPVLASGCSNGSFAVWDLTKGRIAHVQRGAHEKSIAGLQWVTGQPLLMTSSEDNSIKQWVFESPTSVPRLLKFRGRHHAPPAWIRYYGDDGKQILTAGRDRALRYTSVVRDSRSHELSQGSLIKKAFNLGVSADTLKLPQITSIASSSTRSKDWDDVLTAHAGDGIARTWRVQEKRIGTHGLEADEGVIQTACVTACGNFGLVGSSTGEIRMWNMQSGKERRNFSLSGQVLGDVKIQNNGVRKKSVKLQKQEKTIRAVTGLATDTLNTRVVASTLEGVLYFFDFHNTKLLSTLSLPSSMTSISLNRDSNLLLCICDDLTIRLVDIESTRIVRELRGFKGRILDACFSANGRWIIASSLDGCIRTFDIPTGRLIDIFRTESVATSLSFSPTGEFLATSHVDSLGVHLWANRAQFSELSLRHIPEEEDVPEISIPSVQSENVEDVGEELEEIGEPEYDESYISPEQLEDSLVTLTLLPRSRWQTLLNLDTIRARNKPKEPPKAPEKAPFFLPTVQGLETRFDLTSAQQSNEADKGKRIDLGAGAGFVDNDFTRKLAQEDEDGDYAVFFSYLKALPPSTVDLEIRSLLSIDHLSKFLHALAQRLKSHKDFEAIQAYLAVFLRVHSDILIANEELIEPLLEVKEVQKAEADRLVNLVGYSLGTLSFLRSAG